MATKSQIEWTESRHMQKPKTLFQFFRNRQVLCFKPFKNALVFFRRITRNTSRDDILNFRIATLGNWYNMVKSCSRIIAVSTFSFKLHQSLNLSFRFYRFAITFPTVSVLLPFSAIFFVCRISDAGFARFVKLAQSVFRHEFKFQPFLTSTTPFQTFCRHHLTFANTDSVCFWFIATIAAFTFQSIKTSAIFRKKMNGLPLFTNSAFFQSNLNSFQIFGNGKPGFFCGTFNCSFSGLSHISYFRLTNFSIGGEI